MNLRTARKIVLCRSNLLNLQRIMRLRPPYRDEEGHWVHPSFANNPQVAKAWKVVKRHMRYNQYIDRPVRHANRTENTLFRKQNTDKRANQGLIRENFTK